MKPKIVLSYFFLILANTPLFPLEAIAQQVPMPLKAKKAERFERFYQQLVTAVQESPEKVDPEALIREMHKKLHFHHPGLMCTCRDGYKWRIDFRSTLVVKPIANDDWEISTMDSQIALVHPSDVKLFVFEKEKLMDSLPKQLTEDTAIILFAKRYVIVIEPYQSIYADLKWSWRNPYRT